MRSVREKIFRDAIRMEVSQTIDGQKRLRRIAQALAERAIQGDVSAIKEIGDRLDGKVPQAIVGDSDHDPVSVRAIAWLEDVSQPYPPKTIEHEPSPQPIDQSVSQNGANHAQNPPRAVANIRHIGPEEEKLQRNRAWAREHMRKKRAEAKAAKLASASLTEAKGG